MLTVVCGGMFSEKSTELQRRGKRLKRAGKKVAYFKPDFDNRYSEDEIVTHDGQKVPSINIPTNSPVLLTERQYFEYDVFLIDEVQFFHSTVITAIEVLLKNGKTVIVAGLDMDFSGKPFFVTASLMAVAEEVLKLKAVCYSCGHDSWVSFKEPNGLRIELGSDEYKPMCRSCFNKLKEKDVE